MSKRHISLAVLLCLVVTSFTGCASIKTGMQDAANQNKEVILSVAEEPTLTERKELTWVELDQLSSFKNIRKVWDDKMNIYKFDSNSKNGVMFVELDGSWAGNNTLYNIFQNKTFVKDYYGDGKIQSALAQAAMAEFDDVKGEAPGIAASVNAYFNIIPTNTDGTSGMENYLTRAEAMAAIYRADTPVTLNEVPEDFVNVVGENVFNEYAFNLADYSYLDYKNGSLNSTAYNDTITRAEVVYMIVKRYFPEEMESVNLTNQFNDCVNAGNLVDKIGIKDKHAWQAYTLEYSLQNPSEGLDEELYKAMVVAKNRGIITSNTRWNSGIRGGEMIIFLINTYQSINRADGFKVTANSGSNAGSSLYVKNEPVVEEKPVGTEQVIEIGGSHKLSDLADIDDLIAAYGDEIDMTPEEIEEAKLIGDQFTIEEYDTYLTVDHCRALNVRTGPSTDYRIIKCVKKGTIVHVVGVCAENGWYRVIADGKISYQCGVYFSEIQE